MYTFILKLFLLISIFITSIEVRPVSKFEQNHETSTIQNHQIIGNIWNDIQPLLNDHINSHLSDLTKPICKRLINHQFLIDNGDYIEYCLEKILNPDGKTYSTKTSEILYKIDGRKISLHQAESNIEIQTYPYS